MAMQSMPNKPLKGADWDGWGDTIDANVRSAVTDVPALQTAMAALTQRVTNAENNLASKATLSGLASVATSGNYADLIGTPPQTVISTTSTTDRPSNSQSVIVAWHTTEPPTNLMLPGDYWVPTGI